jgi:hypothetical protein
MTAPVEPGCVRRRTALAGAGVLATAAGGCLRGVPGVGTTEVTAPAQLSDVHEAGSCTTDRVVASVAFSGRLADPGEASVVAPDRILDEPAQQLVRFALDRGRAVACKGDDTRPFRSLLSTLTDHQARYRETNGELPATTAVRLADGYYRLTELRVRDQVLVV